MEEATQGSLMHGLKPKPLELVGFSPLSVALLAR
jgi:hypothetical protein